MWNLYDSEDTNLSECVLKKCVRELIASVFYSEDICNLLIINHTFKKLEAELTIRSA